MPFSIVRDELARQAVDAVVVPANAALHIDGGAGLAVGRVAGLEDLQHACDAIGGCPEGSAVATPAFAFPANVLIHAVGPVWDDSEHVQAALRSAYENALRLAVEHGAASIAMPLISSGAYGCPAELSLHVALSCVRSFLYDHDDVDVRIVVFGAEAAQAARSRFADLESFIDDRYADEHQEYLYQAVMLKGASDHRAFECVVEAAPCASVFCAPAPCDTGQMLPLGDLLDVIDEPFSTTLLAIIDSRGLTDAEVYKQANMSRQHFSKIRSNPQYQPTKKTVLALAIALRLSLDETRDLLERAGFALSHSSKMDLIVEWFIGQGNYDVFEINEALYHYDQPILG